jgi:hypothetical protein
MKLLIVIIFFIISCSENPKNWEYKVERFVNNGYQRTGEEAAKPSVINITEARLNELGGEGWELVSTSIEMETSYVNFGSEKYVTGLQPNVRPQSIICIFKRIKMVK